MMMRLLISLSILFTAWALSPGVVLAAQSSPTVAPDKSIVVSPFLNETRILANEATKDVSISLTNNTAKRQSFHVTTLDFGSLNETGGVVFAGDNASKLSRKYGLANWLKLPTDQITIEAGESKKLQATIVNEPTLGPGGHYAAIIMTVDNPASATDDSVNVQQKISALLFATKVGGEIYDLKLDKIQPDGNWQQLPGNILLKFKNTGNVHVVPRGTVKLISPSGHVVSQGVINEASSYVLPETTRQFFVQLQGISNHGWEAGTYKLQVDYRYDGYAKFASKTFSIKYYNISGIILGLVILFVAGFIGYSLLRKWSAAKAKNGPEINA